MMPTVPTWAKLVGVAVGFPVAGVGAHIAHELTHLLAARVVRARVIDYRIGLLSGGVAFSVTSPFARLRAAVVNLAPTIVTAVTLGGVVALVGVPEPSIASVVGAAVLLVYWWPSSDDLGIDVRTYRQAAGRLVESYRPNWPVPAGFWVGMTLLYLSMGVGFLLGQADPDPAIYLALGNVSAGLGIAGAIKTAFAMQKWRQTRADRPEGDSSTRCATKSGDRF